MVWDATHIVLYTFSHLIEQEKDLFAKSCPSKYSRLWVCAFAEVFVAFTKFWPNKKTIRVFSAEDSLGLTLHRLNSTIRQKTSCQIFGATQWAISMICASTAPEDDHVLPLVTLNFPMEKKWFESPRCQQLREFYIAYGILGSTRISEWVSSLL